MDLKKLKISVRDYVFRLEETVLSGTTAVWIGRIPTAGQARSMDWRHCDKIASIGVRIRRRITSHGFSLNVDLKIDPTSFMVCCGTPGIRMVSLNELLSDPVPPWHR